MMPGASESDVAAGPFITPFTKLTTEPSLILSSPVTRNDSIVGSICRSGKRTMTRFLVRMSGER